MQTRSHRIADSDKYAGAPQTVPPPRRRPWYKLAKLASLHPWKADFNQCTGSQLIRALKRAESRHAQKNTVLPFVLIGHSKIFTKLNERSLRPFLEFVQNNSERFGFANLSEAESFAS
jgi:hypothetical protein